MYRPSFSYLISPPPHNQQTWARVLAPLSLWICVCLSLRFGYYGNYHLVLGPNSSRLFKASSMFVEKIQVRDNSNRGLLLYGFSGRPDLSLETNWTVSNNVFVDSFHRGGFSLWLNKGSRIRMKWELKTRSFNDVLVVLIKGEKNFKTVETYPTRTGDLGAAKFTNGNGEGEYVVEEDDRHYIGVVNLNPHSIVMAITVHLSSKMYDTTTANTNCSTANGFCSLNLLFPNTHYVLLITPHKGDSNAWYIELSFVVRLITYVVVLGFVVVIIFLVLKWLGASNGETRVEEARETETQTETETWNETQTETDPLISEKETPVTYGAVEDDLESSLCSSSEELYDCKICVICYDQPRNSFFVPCGHCATCYACAQRIAEEESRTCPICRRLIHRVRRLLSP